MELAYYEAFQTKEEAMRREWEIKHMTRKRKILLIEHRSDNEKTEGADKESRR